MLNNCFSFFKNLPFLQTLNACKQNRLKLFVFSSILFAGLFTFLLQPALAQELPGLNVSKNAAGGQTYSLTLQLLILLTSLTFLPAVILMMTSFTRIIIVLSLLRSALGTTNSPPNQVLIGLALFMTFFIMSPVIDDIYKNNNNYDKINKDNYIESNYEKIKIISLPNINDIIDYVTMFNNINLSSTAKLATFK